MTFTVAAALDAYVERESPPREPDGLWHPSSISGCARRAIYEMRQVPQTDPQTPKQKRILFLGSRFHEVMQAAVKSAPGVVAVYTEVKVLIPELNLTGAADQVVVLLVEHEDGSVELQEFKTIKEWGFRKLTGPKDDHLEQCKSYVLALRDFGGVADDGTVLPPFGNRLSRIRFTYIEKQTLDTREFIVDWLPRWEADVRQTIADLEAYRADPESLPPRLPMNGSKRDYRCDWGWGKCQFLTQCWETDGAGTAVATAE